MNKIFLLFYVFCISASLFFISDAPNASDDLPPERGNSYFNNVHSWPDGKCDLCHVSAEPGADTAELIHDDISMLCEDCHSDTATVITSQHDLRSILHLDNHPIKFSPLDFDSDRISHAVINKDGRYYVTGPSGRVRLYGNSPETAIVECSSCHDPHGRSVKPFLRFTETTEEGFCTTCHISARK